MQSRRRDVRCLRDRNPARWIEQNDQDKERQGRSQTNPCFQPFERLQLARDAAPGRAKMPLYERCKERWQPNAEAHVYPPNAQGCSTVYHIARKWQCRPSAYSGCGAQRSF
jgi:hypothetical protein